MINSYERQGVFIGKTFILRYVSIKSFRIDIHRVLLYTQKNFY